MNIFHIAFYEDIHRRAYIGATHKVIKIVNKCIFSRSIFRHTLLFDSGRANQPHP